MAVGLAPDNDPIDYPNLPPTANTVLAHRLIPVWRTATPPFGTVIIAGIPVVAAGVTAPWMTDPVPLIYASFLPLAGVAAWFMCRSVWRVPLYPPPLARVFPTWESITRALRTSPHQVPFRGEIVRERDHLFLGSIAGTPKVALLHESYLRLPAIIVGRTGIGKTKLVMLPLLTQAVRRRSMHLLIIDYKVDPGFFRSLGIEAARSRVDLKYLTIEPGKSSYLWNPLEDPAVALLTRDQFLQIFLRSLSLVTGQEGGTGYFGAQSEERTRRTLEQAWPSSVAELYRLMRDQRASDLDMSEKDFTNTGHLVANLARIASVGVLNAIPGDVPESAIRGAISLLDILSKPGVTVLMLPAQLEPTTAMFVGKLVIHVLAAVAKVYTGPRVPVLIAVDEAQELLAGGGMDLATPLRQSRESQISMWLGFQDLAALRTGQVDFAPALLANAPLKVFASAEDLVGRDYLMRTSGETTRILRSVTATRTQVPNGYRHGSAVQHRQEAIPRVDEELINKVNRDPKSFIVVASESRGFTQFKHPIVVRSSFHISKQEADRRAAVPWPKGNQFTVTVKTALAQPTSEARPTEHAPAADAPEKPPVQAEQAAAPPETNPVPPAPPAAAPARRRGRPRKVKQEETPRAPEGLEDNEMAQYLKKLAGEVPQGANGEGGQ